jgi:hypothetical protein
VGTDWGWRFGPLVALTISMETDETVEQDWERLCDAVVAERDPLRMSELLDRLLRRIDERRALRSLERDPAAGSGDGST